MRGCAQLGEQHFDRGDLLPEDPLEPPSLVPPPLPLEPALPEPPLPPSPEAPDSPPSSSSSPFEDEQAGVTTSKHELKSTGSHERRRNLRMKAPLHRAQPAQ